MYKLEFTLKQHTPLIHFQQVQSGATLRATEVKPKLDKYILEVSGSNISPEMILKNENSEALDYKLKFKHVVTKEFKLDDNFGSFFGAMGSENLKNPKYLNIANHEIIAEILCYNQSLKGIIRENLNRFFALHNFGTRQSKGFGSFVLTKIEDENQQFPEELFSYSFCLKYNSSIIDFSSQRVISESIDYFYRSLRSGINLAGRNGELYYFKSALFCYLNSKSIQWDKKTIKANYFNKKDITVSEIKKGQTKYVDIIYLPTQQNNLKEYYGETPDILLNPLIQDNTHSHKLFRDRLGLSNDEKWYSYRDNIKKTEANNVHGSWIRKNREEDQISRYKSPILFKPVINESNKSVTVYFDLFEDVSSLINYENRMFNIYTKPESTVPQISSQQNLFMPIANRIDFKLKSFLEYAFSNIDPEKHADKSEDQDLRMIKVAETLSNIFSQLKKQIASKHGTK